MKGNKIIWSLLSTGIEFVIGFGVITLITRLYDKEVVGVWFIFMAIFSVASGMRDAFVQTALVKGSVGVKEDDQFGSLKANLLTTLTLELVISMIIAGVALIGTGDLYSLLLLYPTYSIPNALFRWTNFYFRGRIEPNKVLIQNLINLLALGTGFTIVVFKSLPIEYLIIAWGASNVVALMCLMPQIPLRKILASKWQVSDFKLIFKYGSFATLRELTATVSTRIGVFLSGSMLGLSQTALLGTAQRYTQIAFLPNNALQALLFPELVKHANLGQKQETAKALTYGLARILALVFLVGGAIVVGAYPIVYFLHGSDYLAAAPILMLFVFITSFFTPFGTAFGSMVTAIGKPHLSSKIVFINSLLNISLTYVLIKNMGLYGVPIALLLTEIFGFIVIGKILKTEAKISFSKILNLVPSVYKHWALIALSKLNAKLKTAAS